LSAGVPSLPSTPPRSPEQPAAPRRLRDGAGPARRRPSERHSSRWAPSPVLRAREIALVALAGLALALLTTWPLVLHMGSRISPDLGDPIRTAWQIAWVGHAMLSNPLHLFNSNAFYPHPLSLAFSDSLLGYGPAAFFGSGAVAALVRYNLLFLFAWSLCFVGAYLLARELGLGRIAGAAAGIAFAYAPYRVTEAGHLHVISSGGIPLALFLLLRGYRRGSRALVLAGWLVSAWQVSLGFTLGLQYCYLLAVIVAILVVRWWRARRREGATGPLIPRRLLGVTIAGIVVLAAVGAYQAHPYLQVSHKYPSAKRTIREVKNYSSGFPALLSASSENRVWGSATSGMRAKVHSKNEDVFFPGGLILALAIVGLWCSAYPRRLRIALAVGIGVVSILALGLGLNHPGYPYRLMYDFAPGWNGVRVPGRIFTLATLFYALLAGAGVQLIVTRVRARMGEGAERDDGDPRPGRRGAVLVGLPAALGVILALAILGEGAGRLAHPVVPQPAAAETRLAGPLLDLPTDGALDRVWQYYSTDGFPKIPIGNSTFDIPAVDDLRGGMNGFPDRRSIEKLRYYGIRTVVLHTVIPKGLPPEHGLDFPEPPNPVAAAAKPIDGLGVTRERVGSLVIYRIGPGPKALHGSA
jgi:hypothetical protein